MVSDNAGRNRLVINLLLVATFVVILNETLMAVALPRLMHDLKVTADAVQWLTTAFLLTMSVGSTLALTIGALWVERPPISIGSRVKASC